MKVVRGRKFDSFCVHKHFFANFELEGSLVIKIQFLHGKLIIFIKINAIHNKSVFKKLKILWSILFVFKKYCKSGLQALESLYKTLCRNLIKRDF